MSGFKLADSFGYESPFQTPNDSQEYYEKGIDYLKLIKEYRKYRRLLFNYEDYALDDIIAGYSSPYVSTGKRITPNKYLTKKDEQGKTVFIKTTGKLNTTKASVSRTNRNSVFEFEIEVGEYTKYIKQAKYEFNDNIAFQIETYNYEDYLEVSKQAKTEPDDSVGKEVTNKFNEAFKANKNDVSKLDWLYENAPLFVLTQKTESDLWDDFIQLLFYDNNKWFIDSSNAMIKVLSAIAAIKDGMIFLYNQFNDNPELIKDIYDVLDKSNKSEEFNGIEIPNKSIFASLLRKITFYNFQGLKNEDRLKQNPIFKITAGYRVDSNVYESNDASISTYNLTQEYFSVQNAIFNTSGGYAGMGLITPKHNTWLPLGKTYALHPLDIVRLTITDEKGGEITIPMPAIVVKDLAYQREWGEIQQMLRIGGDILALALGIAALFTGNPTLIVLGVADILLSGGDILVQIRKDKLMQTAKGRAF